MPELRKRETAYKIQIGDVQKGTPIVEESKDSETEATKERFRFLELGNKQVVRVNIVANVIEKYISGGDRKFATITLDDASGQIRLKAFGDDIKKFEALNQGDTIVVIGLLRSYNKEVYIMPEVMKKLDPRYLLVRKLELESEMPKPVTAARKQEALALKDRIIEIIRSGEDNNGVDTEELITKIKDSSPDMIHQEIIKLLEDGMIYEPRPGKVRWLG